MKIQSKSIAIALLIAGAACCSAQSTMAQTAGDASGNTAKVTTAQKATDLRQSAHDRNTELINKYLQTSDEATAFGFISQIRNGLTEELAATKRQIQAANQAQDEAAAHKTMAYNNDLSSIYNSIVQNARDSDTFNKEAVDQALAKYLKLKL